MNMGDSSIHNMALRSKQSNQMLDMPPFIAKYGSEPSQKPDEYWDKFTQYIRLTQGIDADDEIRLYKERKDVANASRDFGEENVKRNDKNMPILKDAFIWYVGDPVVKTLETRFAGAKLKTKTLTEILEEWKKTYEIEVNKIGKYTQLLNTVQKEGQPDLDFWFTCNERVAKCEVATDNPVDISKILTQVIFFNGLKDKKEAQKYRDWVFLKSRTFEDLQRHLNTAKINKKTSELLDTTKIKTEPIGRLGGDSDSESDQPSSSNSGKRPQRRKNSEKRDTEK